MLFITVCSRWWESWYMDNLLGLGRLSCILASFNKVAQLCYPWHCFTTILVLGKSCSWVSRLSDRFINTNRIAIVKVCTSNNPRQPPSWLKRKRYHELHASFDHNFKVCFNAEDHCNLEPTWNSCKRRPKNLMRLCDSAHLLLYSFLRGDVEGLREDPNLFLLPRRNASITIRVHVGIPKSSVVHPFQVAFDCFSANFNLNADGRHEWTVTYDTDLEHCGAVNTGTQEPIWQYISMHTRNRSRVSLLPRVDNGMIVAFIAKKGWNQRRLVQNMYKEVQLIWQSSGNGQFMEACNLSFKMRISKLVLIFFALILACGFCNASVDIRVHVGIPKGPDYFLVDFHCFSANFQLRADERYEWKVRGNYLERCGAVHSLTNLAVYFSAFDDREDRPHTLIYWAIKSDGVYRSYDQKLWVKKSGWAP
ncbi:hypothetical protein VNO77_05119 [Canavalia gladiata]|uniref:Uncharacterized protein n=1 Tax=Canavalia gladiata TaxID=3824 RepID=A0AAN9N3G1_CANGL